MERDRASFSKYIFVCENEKEGACCGAAGSRIREELKKSIKAMGLDRKIRVSRTGCLDVCSEGPNVLVMPEALWFKKVSSSDIGEILQTVTQGVSQ